MDPPILSSLLLPGQASEQGPVEQSPEDSSDWHDADQDAIGESRAHRDVKSGNEGVNVDSRNFA